MSENGSEKNNETNKPNKKDLTKKAFNIWIETAVARMGMAAVGVPEEKKEALKLLLECCFEQAFSAGGHLAIEHAADEISGAIASKLNGKINGNGVVVDVGKSIPMPGHGEA